MFRNYSEPSDFLPVNTAIENAVFVAIFGKEMMLLRFVVLAGVLAVVGFYAPGHAVAAVPAGAVLLTSAELAEQKKADPPIRPRPKPGPKDGGEDE